MNNRRTPHLGLGLAVWKAPGSSGRSPVSRIRRLFVLSLLSAAWLFPALHPTPPGAVFPKREFRCGQGCPSVFEANRGQAPGDVRFVARGSGFRLLLTSSEAIIVPDPAPATGPAAPAPASVRPSLPGGMATSSRTIRMTFPGAKPGRLVPESPLPGTVNYLRGPSPADWLTGIPTWAGIRWRDAWPGVDVVFSSRDGRLCYDFVLAPGASPGRIRIAFEGAAGVAVDPAGELAITTASGVLRHQRPLVYQQTPAGREPLAGRFCPAPAPARGGDAPAIGFEAEWKHPELALVIDPTMVYSSFLGGSDGDAGFGVAVDNQGFIYLAGDTYSADFPLQNPYDASQGGSLDLFVAKLTPDGQELVYCTFLGGSGRDSLDVTASGGGFAIDGSGQVHLAGITESSNFPQANAYDPWYGGQGDAFVTKLNAAGNGLVFSTYLGGSGVDAAGALSLDPTGNMYGCGQTGSTNFPVLSAYQSSRKGSKDAFAAKFSPAGQLAYATYLGGGGDDVGYGIDVDGGGQAYVTGMTKSGDFPITAGAWQPSRPGLEDAFVTKLNAAGNGLVYSTYLGGSYNDQGFSILVNSAGEAYVMGSTVSLNFPTTSGACFPAHRGLTDVFITRLNGSGSAPVYSTYFGGYGVDYAFGMALGGDGCLHLTGQTGSTNFPDFRPLPYLPDRDVFASADGGGSFLQNELEGFQVSSRAQELAVDPSDPQRAYLGTSDHGMYRTTDGGATWQRTNTGLSNTEQIYALAIRPSNPQVVYAAGFQAHLARSTNGGSDWTVLTDYSSPPFVNALALHPTDPDTLYGATTFDGFIRSTDGGVHWTALNTGLPPSIPGLQFLAMDPANPANLYTASDMYGVYRSTDGGGSWTETNSGLPNKQIRSFCLLAGSPPTLLAGPLNAGLFRSTDGGASWHRPGPDLPAGLNVDPLAPAPAAPGTVYAGVNVHYDSGALFKSTDWGQSWTGTGLSGLVTGLAAAPADAARVYAGAYGSHYAFAATLNPTGTSLAFGSRLGCGNETGTGVAIDAAGWLLLTGAVQSPNFPVVDALQAQIGGAGASDAYLLMLAPSASRLGDVNADGRIDVLDPAWLGCWLAGRPLAIDAGAADLDGDGQTTAADRLLLAHYLAELPDSELGF